jgi:hypothetical protein
MFSKVYLSLLIFGILISWKLFRILGWESLARS